MKVVFLHIPKTAGQSVEKGLRVAFGRPAMSPIRTHSQAKGSCFEDWDRYKVFAGHLDWDDLEHLDGPKFVFSILREPKERVASFYFYLVKEAQKLGPRALEKPENAGKKAILQMSAEDYFLGGDARWQDFVRSHYDNFYCSYFGRQRFRPGIDFLNAAVGERLAAAQNGILQLDALATTTSLGPLETRISAVVGTSVAFSKRRVNRGPLAQSVSRWAALKDALGSDKAVARLRSYTALDEDIYTRACTGAFENAV